MVQEIKEAREVRERVRAKSQFIMRCIKVAMDADRVLRIEQIEGNETMLTTEYLKRLEQDIDLAYLEEFAVGLPGFDKIAQHLTRRYRPHFGDGPDSQQEDHKPLRFR